MSKRIFALLIALFVLVPAGFALTASAEESVNLRFAYWGSGAEKEGVDVAITEFEKANPNIKVERLHIPDDFVTKLNAMIAANEAPDVCYSGPWKIQLGKDGLIYNYYEIAELDPSISADDVADYCWWKWSETESAGPYQASVCPSLMYNVDLFNEAGVELPPTKAEDAWTWDEFVEVAQRLTFDRSGRNALDPAFDPEDIQQYGIQMSTGWNGWYPFVLSNGGKYLTEDGTAFGLNSPEATEALQKVADLINVYHVHPTPAASSTLPGTATALQTRRVAISIQGSWTHADLALTEDFNWGVGVLPIHKEYKSFFHGGSLVIFKSTKSLESALKLHNWIINPANVIELHKGLWVPQLNSWYTDPEKIALWAEEGTPGRPIGFQDAVMKSTFEHAEPSPENCVVNFAEIDALVWPALDNVWNGSMTAQEAMDSIADPVNALVAGWIY
ncbi:MAG: sugar ABC transporter substrate-binding protein [Oscillospiraceae bacterium]|jgi:multiple sugar transport system substrate-binding protein|nr:sugar ABC transporter substrate-binding protein [Oscillospiraceae bacterium]